MESEKAKNLVLVRIKRGQKELALKRLKASENVDEVDTTLGPCDIMITTRTNNLADLKQFEEFLRSENFYDGYTAMPTVQEWNRPEHPGLPIYGWVLISASDPMDTFNHLRAFEGVQKAFRTVGQYNVIARISADTEQMLSQLVDNDIIQINGVREIKTLTYFKNN